MRASFSNKIPFLLSKIPQSFFPEFLKYLTPNFLVQKFNLDKILLFNILEFWRQNLMVLEHFTLESINYLHFRAKNLGFLSENSILKRINF